MWESKNLANNNFKFTFTCRSNRPTELFKNFLHEEMQNDAEVGKVVFAINEDETIGACSWEDKSVVNFISNIHFNETVEVTRRKNRKKVIMKIPRVAQDYTQIGMGQVDAFDAYAVRYRAKHKNKSWKRAHFLQLFTYTVINCFHIYRMHNKKSDLTYREFLKLCRQSFVERYAARIEQMKEAKITEQKMKDQIRQQNYRRRKKEQQAALAIVSLNDN